MPRGNKGAGSHPVGQPGRRSGMKTSKIASAAPLTALVFLILVIAFIVHDQENAKSGSSPRRYKNRSSAGTCCLRSYVTNYSGLRH
jgi:hypothetical protein